MNILNKAFFILFILLITPSFAFADYTFEINKGSVTIDPSEISEFDYTISAKENADKIKVTKLDKGLKIEAPRETKNVKILLKVPAKEAIFISLSVGNLTVNKIDNPITAKVSVGNLDFIPHPNIQGTQEAKLTLNTGNVTLQDLSTLSAQIKGSVNVGNIDWVKSFKVVEKSRKITRETAHLTQGSAPYRYLIEAKILTGNLNVK